MPRALRAAVDLIKGDTWPKRRLVIYAGLLLCALVIAACLGAAIAANDMDAVKQTSGDAFWYGFSILVLYVTGGIVDDVDKRRSQRKEAEITQPTKTEGE